MALSLPRLAIASRINTKGEGIFQSFLSAYATTHRVKTLDDIGIDYFCEWIRQETESSFESTNVLFAVQLKTSNKDKVKIIKRNVDMGRNFLERFELKKKNGGNYYYIKPKTVGYWRGFEIPIYLFVVLLSDFENELYYKRYIPILHNDPKLNEVNFFYKANKGNNFLAFSTKQNTGGFCRDLFIDYIRCNYKKGSITYKNPREMGLNQFSESEAIFIDMISVQYKTEIENTFSKLKALGLFTNKKLV